MVTRWIFYDPAGATETYVLPKNPSAMTSPWPKHMTTPFAISPVNGSSYSFRTGTDTPTEWQFSGSLTNKTDYDAFRSWIAKPNRILITDHLSRQWLCWLTAFEPTSKPTTFRSKQRWSYVIKALNYGQQ